MRALADLLSRQTAATRCRGDAHVRVIETRKITVKVRPLSRVAKSWHAGYTAAYTAVLARVRAVFRAIR